MISYVRQQEKKMEKELLKLGTDFDYPRAEDGKIALRGLGRKVPFDGPSRRKSLPTPDEDAPGGLDFTLRQLFGSRHEGVRLIEGIVSAQGKQADPRWIQLLLIWRHWNDRVERGEDIGRPLTLNQVCYELDIPTGEFMKSVASGIMETARQNALLRAALSVDEVITSTVLASRDLEKGGKDRELILRMAKVIDDKPGMSVNVNQQVGVAVSMKAEDLKAPLRRFREDIIDIDNMARADDTRDDPKN